MEIKVFRELAAFTLVFSLFFCLFAGTAKSDDEYITPNRRVVKLPAPVTAGGATLLEALSKRMTSRSFSDKPFTRQQISDLLWAASGINRKDSAKMTAPTALNWQEIDIYVATKEGVYFHNRVKNVLELVLAKDVMKETGKQEFVGTGALEMIFVADYSKMKHGNVSEEKKVIYSRTDTGFISQNVYLFCAANGLNTVVRGLVPYDELHKTLNLRADQKITYCQTVGFAPGK